MDAFQGTYKTSPHDMRSFLAFLLLFPIFSTLINNDHSVTDLLDCNQWVFCDYSVSAGVHNTMDTVTLIVVLFDIEGRFNFYVHRSATDHFRNGAG